MEKFDVIIIGGGLAGFSAAAILARKGAGVLVIEKERSLGLPLRCAELIETIDLDAIEIFKDQIVVQKVDRVDYVISSETVLSLRIDCTMIRKDLYIQALAHKALKSGARLMLGTRVSGISPDTVTAGGKTMKGTVIIGADGPQSIAGKYIGSQNSRQLAGLQYTYIAEKRESRLEMHFEKMYTEGFGWVFPKKELVHVGVCMNPRTGGRITEALDYFTSLLTKGKRIKDHNIIAINSGIIPVNGILPELQKDNILLIGDAAGLTHPLNGGGNLDAIKSGKVSADIIYMALAKGDLSLLQKYTPLMHRNTQHQSAVNKRSMIGDLWEKQSLDEIIRNTWCIV